jgi:D-alanyl-D-alanine dipeptidase
MKNLVERVRETWLFILYFIKIASLVANKILNAFYMQTYAIIILSTVMAINVNAQDLKIISRYKTYANQVKNDSTKRMIELRRIVPDLLYDLRYGGVDNFLHERLYSRGNRTYLRLSVARALANVSRELSNKGFTLKIWDAYRPYSVTVKMWEAIKDERYVADPKKGSGHNRGAAIDLTLVDKNTGKELNMGTDFDNFSDTAHQDFTQLPPGVLQNRLLLKTAMEKYGFIALPTEWWHYYWNKANDFDLLDIDFKKFK